MSFVRPAFAVLLLALLGAPARAQAARPESGAPAGTEDPGFEDDTPAPGETQPAQPPAPATAPATAPVAPASQSVAPPRTISAQRLKGEIHIDGRLDEPEWATAPVGGDFFQKNPDEGKPPKFPTEFRVLYDEHALYVGIRAHDAEPQLIRSALTRRDEDSPSDTVCVGIDSYHDRRTAFLFCVSPAGVQQDYLLYDDTNQDVSWNAVWQADTSIDAAGWSAELRIPYNQLRFAHAEEQTWGLQVRRWVDRTHEESYWAPMPRDATRGVGLFGDLVGIHGVSPSLRLELLPYIVAGAHLFETSSLGDNSAIGDLGLDLKLGLSSNLTLDATVNPDFGQVEADPSIVNLSAYEPFFPDKRPFFLEGIDIFRFTIGSDDSSSESMFYSRRIGARPYGSPEGYTLLSGPDATRIYGAAKVSGKVSGGWSVGLLSALTSEMSSRIDDGSGQPKEEVVEPLTSFNILRVRKDFDNGRTIIGAALTSVFRDLPDGVSLDPTQPNATFKKMFHDEALTGGLEYTQLFGATSNYQLALKVFGSFVHGTPEALDVTQRSSRHYFQRPGADYLGYDPTRTSLLGLGGQYVLTKASGGHIRGGLGGDLRSPGLDVNDLGYQRTSDQFTPWAWLQYHEDQPGEILRRWSVYTSAWENMDLQPQHLGMGWNLNANVTLLNYWVGFLSYNTTFGMWDVAALRGGPALHDDFAHNLFGLVTSDTRRRLYGSLSGNVWHQPASGSFSANGSLDATLQVRPNLLINVGLQLATRSADQYVEEGIDAAGRSHYVVAHIDQDTLGLTLRLNYTLSRRLSLQVYAQPFIAVGGYSGYKEADHADSPTYVDRFHYYTPDEISEAADVFTVHRADATQDFSFARPDFNLRELHSNVVLRWEYRPGSTLFLVWTHGRDSSDTVGRLSLGNDVSQMFAADGAHVVMLKLNYWMGT